MELQIKIATTKKDYDSVRQLIEEYAAIRNYDVALGDYKKELAELPGKYAAPKGTLLIAYWQEKPAGCVALREFGEGICEMKRMFVSEKYRGKKIGQQLVEKIIQQGKMLNYQKMYLDTHPWMYAAQYIYKLYGFRTIPAYHYNPTKGIKFFEKDLI